LMIPMLWKVEHRKWPDEVCFSFFFKILVSDLIMKAC